MTTLRLSVNGVTLGAELRGPPVAAPALVLLHGFTGSAAGWERHLDTFAQAGLRVVALDMLGHGQSDAPLDPERYRIERCRADILAALSALDVLPEDAVLLGYSMGGRIALYTALAGGFRGLVLESASPGLASPAEREQRRHSDEALAEDIERDGLPAFIDRWERLPLFASQRTLPDAVRASLRAERLANRPEGLANSLRGVGTGAQPSLWEELPRLRTPVLLLAGALDTKFMAIAREMAALLPFAQLQIVEGAGHTLHLEQPSVFDGAILRFCETHGVVGTIR